MHSSNHFWCLILLVLLTSITNFPVCSGAALGDLGAKNNQGGLLIEGKKDELLRSNPVDDNDDNDTNDSRFPETGHRIDPSIEMTLKPDLTAHRPNQQAPADAADTDDDDELYASKGDETNAISVLGLDSFAGDLDAAEDNTDDIFAAAAEMELERLLAALGAGAPDDLQSQVSPFEKDLTARHPPPPLFQLPPVVCPASHPCAGRAAFCVTLWHMQQYELPDRDKLAVSVYPAIVAESTVHIRFSTDERVRWWKGLVLMRFYSRFRGSNKRRLLASLRGKSQKGPLDVYIDRKLLTNHVLVFAKAKQFGVYRNMYCLRNAKNVLQGGHTYDFRWIRD